jgi:hypothetical protein
MHLPGRSLFVDMEVFVGSHITFGIPRSLPWRVMKKAHSKGALALAVLKRIGLHGASRMTRSILDPKGEIQEAILEAVWW